MTLHEHLIWEFQIPVSLRTTTSPPASILPMCCQDFLTPLHASPSMCTKVHDYSRIGSVTLGSLQEGLSHKL